MVFDNALLAPKFQIGQNYRQDNSCPIEAIHWESSWQWWHASISDVAAWQRVEIFTLQHYSNLYLKPAYPEVLCVKVLATCWRYLPGAWTAGSSATQEPLTAWNIPVSSICGPNQYRLLWRNPGVKRLSSDEQERVEETRYACAHPVPRR